MTTDTPGGRVPTEGTGTISVEALDNARPRADGYKSLTNFVFNFGEVAAAFRGRALDGTARVFFAQAALRLDAAHLQLLAARSTFDARSQHPDGSIPLRCALYDAVGQSVMTVVGLYVAVKLARMLREPFGMGCPFPDFVRERETAIKKLRDSWEHIDERALGTRGSSDFFDLEALFSPERVVAYDEHRFSLNDEATEVVRALRAYLKDAWVSLCA